MWQLCDLIERFKVPRVTVETNGIGGYAPAFLKAALKKRGLRCAVREHMLDWLRREQPGALLHAAVAADAGPA